MRQGSAPLADHADRDRDLNRDGGHGQLPTRARWTTALTVCAFALLVVALVWLVHDYAVDAIYYDQWSDVNVIAHPSLHVLWAVHNENRILFPNLVVLALSATTRFDVAAEVYLNTGLWLATAAFLIGAHKRRSPATPWLYYLPVTVVLVSIDSGVDLLIGFNVSWYLVLVALGATLYLLDVPMFGWYSFVGAVVCAVVGSYSSLQGLLIWPAALVLLCCRSRSRTIIAVWIGAALVTSAVYFYGFGSSTTSDPSYVFSHPASAVTFLFATVGDVAGQGVTSSGIGVPSLVLGAAIVATSLWLLVAYGFRRDSTGCTIGTVVIVYGLLFDGSVVLGRAWLGLVLAGVDRYVPFNLLLVAGCYLVLLDHPPSRIGRTWGPRIHLLAAAGIAVAVVVVLTVGTANGLSGARSTHRTLSRAAAVLKNIDQVPNSLVTLALYPPAAFSASSVTDATVRAEARVLAERGLSVYAPGAGKAAGTGRPPASTSVTWPAAGSTISGKALLRASALVRVDSLTVGATRTSFVVSGGTLHDSIVGGAHASAYGWVWAWDTRAVPDGTYSVRSVASFPGGRRASSRPVAVTVSNP